MGVHHVAIATKDVEATHAFYTEVMGFKLVKVEVVASPGGGGGWAKHLFFDTGGAGGMLAIWDLHGEEVPASWSPAISEGLGLPVWVNHLAFDGGTLEALDDRRRHMVDRGYVVSEVDHGWCRSIYVVDPNGILVEFCVTTVAFTEDDHRQAQARLADPAPALDKDPTVVLHRPERAPTG